MSQTELKKQDPKKKATNRHPLLATLFRRKKTPLSIYEEEQVQSPLRTIIKTFRENRVGMVALGIFLIILLTVTIGPLVRPIDLGYADSTQQNIAPGFGFMKIPGDLQGNVEQISVGPVFSVGVSQDGQVYAWGNTRISRTVNIADIPENMGHVVQVAVGDDHVLALNDRGDLFSWGNNRQGQGEITPEVEQLTNIKSIYAGYQSSIVLTEDGYIHYFGNDRIVDFKVNEEYQGQYKDVVVSAENFAALTHDGEVIYLGERSSAFSRIPENMGRVVDIAATSNTMAAVNEDGEVFIWGNPSNRRGEARVPETDSKIVELYGGRYHYIARLEDESFVSWGYDNFGQASIPNRVNNSEIEVLYNGYFQNYAITADGDAITWGLRGYLMGTDELGRDTFTRLLNGGRMTMTIGAVAVLISTIIGVIIGGISGYFGGKVDMFFQRIAEMVGSLPFLPFAMILSALIGNRLTSSQRTYLIMVILGLLSWPGLMRLVRAQVFSVREQEYITAAKIVGINQTSIIFKHIVPNVFTVVIVSATLGFSSSMLTESGLSFLGFGVQPPQPTWGNMLNGARNSVVIQNYWWRWVFPSIALSACVICINLVGEALREAIDPKSRER